MSVEKQQRENSSKLCINIRNSFTFSHCKSSKGKLKRTTEALSLEKDFHKTYKR